MKINMNNWELETEHGIYFWGGILSNWARSMFTAKLAPTGNLLEFNTAEQYMMRIKAEVFNDTVSAEQIMLSVDPRHQKRLGRAIIGYSDAVWNPIARDLSYVGIYNKFMQIPSMQKALLGSGDKLIIEASPVDTKWGVGLDYHDLRIFDKAQWRGTNWLGQILMKVRDDIRNGASSEFTKIDWTRYE
jgi:hypothetical protein